MTNSPNFAKAAGLVPVHAHTPETRVTHGPTKVEGIDWVEKPPQEQAKLGVDSAKGEAILEKLRARKAGAAAPSSPQPAVPLRVYAKAEPPAGDTSDRAAAAAVSTSGVPQVEVTAREAESLDLERIPQFSLLVGGAGVGKTYQARRITELDGAVLCATTGIAAMNLGPGVTTLNSIIGYFDTDSLRDLWINGKLSAKLGRLYDSGCRRIVLDECSMTPADQLQILCSAIDDLAEQNRGFKMGLTLVGDPCLAVGTEVILASGGVRRVEELVVGDLLLGPDNTQRRILRLSRGIANLYTVKQTNGDPYTVTGLHQIALRRNANGQREEWGGGDGRRYPEYGEVFTLTALDMETKSAKFRDCFSGYKAGCLEFPAAPVGLDPYFLGLWLGDGDADCARITTPEPEVIEYCQQLAKALGVTAHVAAEYRGARRVALTRGKSNGNKPSPVRSALRACGVLNNKHIPETYLRNSAAVRLELLAGLLDSDGCWGGNRYSITQVREHLARQIKRLADHLGFRTGFGFEAANVVGGNGAWRVTIGGDTWRIPCRVARKRSVVRNLGRSRMTSTVKVKAAGVGAYVGFEVDGDGLFLLADGTVTHNCQLGPVKADYFFECDAFERFKPGITKLTKIWRQTDRDFIEALQAVRCGNKSAAIDYFGSKMERTLVQEFAGTTILAKNDEVDRYNQMRHAMVRGERSEWVSSRWGKERSEWKNVPAALQLKEGALVMVLANCKELDVDGTPTGEYLYVNGDLGSFVTKAPGGFARVRLNRGAEVLVQEVTRENLVPCDSARRKELRLSNPEKLRGDRGEWEAVGGVTYMPLRLAYAATTFKSQGLTLDDVQVSIANHFWEHPGQLYVALSRARTAAGLRIVGSKELLAKRIVVEPKVKGWL